MLHSIERREKGLALLSLLQETQKMRPRRKGKSRGRHSERQKTLKTKRPRGSDTRSQRQNQELGSLKLRRQELRKPEEL